MAENMTKNVVYPNNEIPTLLVWPNATESPHFNSTTAAPMKMLINTQSALTQASEPGLSFMNELKQSLENMTSRFWDHNRREEGEFIRDSPVVQAGEQEFIRTTGGIILMTILLITGRLIVFYYTLLP